MGWLQRLRTYLGYDENAKDLSGHVDYDEAFETLKKAKSALGESEKQRAEIREVAQSLINSRKRNHYGESIQIAMLPRENRK